MALRARLSAPRNEPEEWPWHHSKWSTLPASLIFGGHRRMEAESYLAGGYGIRLALEAQSTGWERLERVATVWKPGRAKGILVAEEFGSPFLAATQVLDVRPVARKWVSIERTKDADICMAEEGQIVVTCSGNVGRSTILSAAHKGTLVSNDLLRVRPKLEKLWGWVYAYLRTPQARAMMTSAQYGHIIKHLEIDHLHALPVPQLQERLLEDYTIRVQQILDYRNRAHISLLAAEARFEQCLGPLRDTDIGESGFSIRASDALFAGRRRFDALPHNPTAREIRNHLTAHGVGFSTLAEAGYSAWLPSRFRRIPAEDGVELLDSSSLYEINPDVFRTIAEVNFGDVEQGRVKAGWLMMSRSGQIYGLIGSVTLATAAHEGKVVSDDVIRIAPTENASIRPGYVYIALSHPSLGRPLVKSVSYGSSIPHIEVADVCQMRIVRLSDADENAIADMAEEASRLRANADILEREVAARAGAVIDRFIAGNMSDVVMVGAT